MERESQNTLSFASISGLFAASLIVSIGTFWAFQRGADDFKVFYAAWEHVTQGRAMEIYRVSPDRFLYAPGFAWLLAPLSWFPKNASLAIWCSIKAALIGWMVREFSKASLERSNLSVGITAWGVLLIARPVLIDFQYGQVNLLILAACVWAMVRHCEENVSPLQDSLSWALAAIAAIAKLFPLPLLLIPFFTTGFQSGAVSKQKLKFERVGAIVGVLLVLFIPLLSIGWSDWVSLMQQWRQALIDRGFPLESHNQSLMAFLQHYTSGIPTEIIAQHRRQLSLGGALFSEKTISLLAACWSLVFAGLILTWILAKPAVIDLRDRLSSHRWIALIVGILVLPSHLVWKPYFVMGLPAAFIATRLWRTQWPVLAAVFVFMNLSGFDILGQEWGARFEAASVLLWSHLLLLFISSNRSFAMMSERSE